jgi:dipeptidase E
MWWWGPAGGLAEIARRAGIAHMWTSAALLGLGAMKLLLTSGGITNGSIRKVLVDLLGKPIAESSALCIPTAAYAMPGGAGMAWKLISGRALSPLCELGWKSLGVLELTALPSIDQELWVPLVKQTDALLVGGGDPLFLCRWMRQSGLAQLFPSLGDAVYVGVSGGSLVMGPNVGEEFVFGRQPIGDDEALGVVGFSMFPHLDNEKLLPDHSLASAERWAARLPVPGYAMDDQTALKVTDGPAEVVSEGHWKLFTPRSHPS